MLQIAGYTIDRIIGVCEEESKATLELASGIVCVIPKHDVKTEALLSWAKSVVAFNSPIALRIINGVVVDAALHLHTSVRALSPQDERPVDVNLWGECGAHRLAGPQAEDEYYPLLARSLASGCELLLLIGKDIEAVVELSTDELDNLKEMSSHPSTIEHPLAHLLPAE